MLRSIVKSGKNLSCFGWDIGSFKIFACKNFDRVKVIEPHDSYEFDFVFLRPPKQLDAFETRDLLGHNSRKDLCSQQRFIGLSVLGRGPSMPNSANHHYSLSVLRVPRNV